jgi:hypothetical protein
VIAGEFAIMGAAKSRETGQLIHSESKKHFGPDTTKQQGLERYCKGFIVLDIEN